MKYFHYLALVTRESAALNFETQYAIPPESGESETESVLMETECLNIMFRTITKTFQLPNFCFSPEAKTKIQPEAVFRIY